NFTPYVFDSPGASVRSVGGFHGDALDHSFSAYARVCTIHSRKPSNELPRGVGSWKIATGSFDPALGALRMGLYASKGVFPSGKTSSTGPCPLSRVTCR